MSAVLQASCDHNVELAGKVREVGITVRADDHPVQLHQHQRGIEQFVDRESGKGATVDVPNIVHPRLQRVQIHTAQLLPNLGYARQREAAELNLLASRDVEHAVSKTPG